TSPRSVERASGTRSDSTTIRGRCAVPCNSECGGASRKKGPAKRAGKYLLALWERVQEFPRALAERRIRVEVPSRAKGVARLAPAALLLEQHAEEIEGLNETRLESDGGSVGFLGLPGAIQVQISPAEVGICYLRCRIDRHRQRSLVR